MKGAILAAMAALSGAVNGFSHQRAHRAHLERSVEESLIQDAPVEDVLHAHPVRSASAFQAANDHLGITFTAYDPQSGGCMSPDQVDQSITRIRQAGFSLVRVYSTDCNTLQNVGNACAKNGLKMIVGVFIGGGGCSYDNPAIKSQVDAIAAWARWDLTSLMVVGNEALQNGLCTPLQLRDLITTVKSKCSYTGPYTTSDTLNNWQRADVQSTLCPVVDMAGANLHAYFNPQTPAQQAGDFVAGQIDILGRACPGKPPITLECGWPSMGNANGAARAGVAEQQAAVASIRSKVGNKVIFFTPHNDKWKPLGSCQCEQSWGTDHIFGL